MLLVDGVPVWRTTGECTRAAAGIFSRFYPPDWCWSFTCSPKPPETVTAHAALDPFGSLCFWGPGKARNSIETRVLTQFRGLGGAEEDRRRELDDEAQDRT